MSVENSPNQRSPVLIINDHYDSCDDYSDLEPGSTKRSPELQELIDRVTFVDYPNYSGRNKILKNPLP